MICQYLNLDEKEIITIGDGENDMDMLLSVGKGIAMGNAAEKVKEIAADICESVTDDGIYYYLKSQKLINE
jgi:hydroxymethylpyrimidine pyrophosphatase-like HAD family hydrolase